MKTLLVIPDTQCAHGRPIKHLGWIGSLIADRQPDTVVHIGDHFDHPSISKYASPADGRRYQKDVDAGIAAIDLMLDTVGRRASGYRGKFVMTQGNHEQRLQRYLAAHPELQGALQDPTDELTQMGWEVVPFLQPITINGTRFCHYFPRSGSGNVMQDRNGAPDARAQALREMVNCTAGHRQNFSYYCHPLGDQVVQSMIAGSCYLHNEPYLTPQGNHHFRGVILKTYQRSGYYDFETISLEQLRRRYS